MAKQRSLLERIYWNRPINEGRYGVVYPIYEDGEIVSAAKE